MNLVNAKSDAADHVAKKKIKTDAEFSLVQDGNKRMKDMYLILRERNKF